MENAIHYARILPKKVGCPHGGERCSFHDDCDQICGTVLRKTQQALAGGGRFVDIDLPKRTISVQSPSDQAEIVRTTLEDKGIFEVGTARKPEGHPFTPTEAGPDARGTEPEHPLPREPNHEGSGIRAHPVGQLTY